MAVSEETKFAALRVCAIVTSSAIEADFQRIINIGQAFTTNVASAFVADHEGIYEDAVLLVHSVARMARMEQDSAQKAWDGLPVFFAMHDIAADEQADMRRSLQSVLDSLEDIAQACETWVAEADDEHKVRLDPTLHTFTATCETHLTNPDPDHLLCCCCGHIEGDHVAYVTLDEARAGYDEIPADERSDFDTYLTQLHENGLITDAALAEHTGGA